MRRVPIEELTHDDISRYLRDVVNGEVLLLTEHGRVVAELGPPRPAARPVLNVGLPQDPKAYLPSPLCSPVRSADLLDAERGER